MPYIFIHGLGQTSSSWDRTVSFLPQHRHIDRPDLTAMINHEEATYNNLYNSFVEYCEGIEGPLHLCGLSLGGILALNYAAEYPEKVASLVLIAAQYEMPKLLLKFQNIIFRFLPNASFQELGFTKKNFIQLTNSILDLNFRKDLIDISCPPLIICGEKDHVNKKASKGLAALIPGANLQFIKNAGHEVNVHAPQTLAEALETFYVKNHL